MGSSIARRCRLALLVAAKWRRFETLRYCNLCALGISALDEIATRFQQAKCQGRRPEAGAHVASHVASHVGNRSHAGIDIRLHRRGVRRIVLLFGRGIAGVHVLEGLVLLLHGLVRRVDGRL
jgi:hypothetical protein